MLKGPAPRLWRPAPEQHLDASTWAYLAGLFDGEGTLSRPTRRNQLVGWRVSIAQLRSTGLCDWIKVTVGYGTVTFHQGSRTNEISNWRCNAQLEVLHFLRHVEPWVRVKRARTLEAITTIEEFSS